MKILYYSPHPTLNALHQAGYATHINEMINAFRELGHEVLPVIMGGSEINEEGEANIHESKIKKNIKNVVPKILWETLKDIQLLKFDKFAENTLYNAVQKFKPDLIYERANYMQLSGINIAKKHKIKHVLEINSPYVEERITLQGKSLLLKTGLKKEKQQLFQTNLPIVVSSALQNYFSEKHNIPQERFLVTPNAINLNKISTDIDKIQHLIEQYKPNEEIIIGFVGSFLRWHGIDILIKAFAQITQNLTNVKLLIIGSGEIETELKFLAKQLCPEKIIFTGKISHDDIFNYISIFDVSIMPNSNWYGSPVKIFEYGIMKKAIIAPNLIPITDVMENRKDAILIKPSVNNLKIALEELVSNVQLRNEISESFYNKIIENYQWQDNALAVLKEISKK